MTHHITIIGLGNYGLDDLPLGIYRFLQAQSHIYVRTEDHPVIEALEGLEIHSFDTIYEAYDTFEAVYDAIVETLFDKAQTEDVVYAVPGHPRVAETTTQLLLQKASDYGVQVEVRGGRSFIDDVFESVGVDPNDGFTMLDATDLSETALNPRTTTLITQVYSPMVAGDLKLSLMTRYPDDFEVHIVDGAHQEGAKRYTRALYEIDHEDVFTNLTSLVIPKVTEETALYDDFDFADGVIAQLVDDETGCPWDKCVRECLLENDHCDQLCEWHRAHQPLTVTQPRLF